MTPLFSAGWQEGKHFRRTLGNRNNLDRLFGKPIVDVRLPHGSRNSRVRRMVNGGFTCFVKTQKTKWCDSVPTCALLRPSALSGGSMRNIFSFAALCVATSLLALRAQAQP